MKMQKLKSEVYEDWVWFYESRRLFLDPTAFKEEIRKIGDLRFKSTWETAFCRFRAMNYRCLLDAYELGTIYLNPSFNPQDVSTPYIPKIFEEMLMDPQGLETIKTCLEQLFLSDYRQERADADGFIELVKAESRREGGRRLPIGSIRELAGACN